jgi:hypothetical protein
LDGSLEEENESKFDLVADICFACRRTIPATIFSHLWLSFLLLAVNRTLLKVVIMQIFVKTLTGEYSNIVFCFILLASNRRKLMLPSTFSSLPSMTLSLSTMKRSCQ